MSQTTYAATRNGCRGPRRGRGSKVPFTQCDRLIEGEGVMRKVSRVFGAGVASALMVGR